ncbi:MAG: NAD-dependent epimerase/dehydratase family protein, partial [bacterium]
MSGEQTLDSESFENVVVFGGDGFLGSVVADVLTNKGYEVTVFDRTHERDVPCDRFIEGDILDKEAVNTAIEGSDVVFNFSAISNIEYAHNNPDETIETNVMGNTNILEACVEFDVDRFMFASTVYVYGDKGSFYRCSKQSCELIIETYNDVHDLPFTVLRYGSIYGPIPGPNNWIYNTIKDALTDKQ